MKTTSLMDLTLREFLDRLASDEPTPGGGAAAALIGALGSALGQMAAALTLSKPRFEPVRDQIEQIVRRLDRAGAMLRQLISEDAVAYEQLAATRKIPRDDPTRAERLEQAASYAAAVPFQVVAIGHRVLHDLQRLEPIGNPNLASDVRAGIALARAAMHAAAENVRANLLWVPEQQSAALSRELDRLLAEHDAPPA